MNYDGVEVSYAAFYQTSFVDLKKKIVNAVAVKIKAIPDVI